MKRVLVTGSSGLIGSEAVESYDRRGYEVHGADNNMRREFFGEKGDTRERDAHQFPVERPGDDHGGWALKSSEGHAPFK